MTIEKINAEQTHITCGSAARNKQNTYVSIPNGASLGILEEQPTPTVVLSLAFQRLAPG